MPPLRKRGGLPTGNAGDFISRGMLCDPETLTITENAWIRYSRCNCWFNRGFQVTRGLRSQSTYAAGGAIPRRRSRND